MVENDTNKAPEVDETLLNPLDTQKNTTSSGTDNQVIKSIVDAETSTAPENLLDAAPEIDMSLLENVTLQKSPLLMILKFTSGFLVFLIFISFLFFTTQLGQKLNIVTDPLKTPNVSKELASSADEVMKLKTDDNYYRFLQIKSYLDLFSFDGDSFLSNYDVVIGKSTSEEQRQKAKTELTNIRASLADSFEKVREKIKVDIAAPFSMSNLGTDDDIQKLFRDKLLEELNTKSTDIAKNKTEDSIRESRNLEQILKIIGNKKLKSLFLSTDFSALTDEQVYKLIKDVNNLVATDFSTIQKIKSNRIRWSEIINQIEMSTVAVDSYYNKKNNYDSIGGIRYTSYDFDTTQKTVSISGETKRIDNQNFSMIARLIDQFNESDLFTGAEMRSFSKTGTFTNGYTASLKLSLTLDNGDKEPNNQTETVNNN